MAVPPKQLTELPVMELGTIIETADGSKFAITSIISSIIDDEDGNYPIIIFECSASLLKSNGGN